MQYLSQPRNLIFNTCYNHFIYVKGVRKYKFPLEYDPKIIPLMFKTKELPYLKPSMFGTIILSVTLYSGSTFVKIYIILV